jgi:hypothetical protein
MELSFVSSCYVVWTADELTAILVPIRMQNRACSQIKLSCSMYVDIAPPCAPLPSSGGSWASPSCNLGLSFLQPARASPERPNTQLGSSLRASLPVARVADRRSSRRRRPPSGPCWFAMHLSYLSNSLCTPVVRLSFSFNTRFYRASAVDCVLV